jgi:hypothetical protein
MSQVSDPKKNRILKNSQPDDSSYVCKSMSQWQSEADKVCSTGQEATYRHSKAKDSLEAARAELARAREIAAHANDSDETANASQTDNSQPIMILELKIRNAELEFSETKGTYEEAKHRLLQLLSAAEGSLTQAKAWSAPQASPRFARALTESETYHEMEAEFLAGIVEQLRDALRSMENQISGRNSSRLRPERKPTERPPDPAPTPRKDGGEWPAPPYLPHPSHPQNRPEGGETPRRGTTPPRARDFVGPLLGLL